jgi:Lamin Tail Domain
VNLRFVASAVAVAIAMVGVPPATALAVPKVHFGIIQYDPPGSDTPVTNKKLNAEWVVIRNSRTSAVQLKGWRVSDPAGHVYRFGRLRLGAGKAVRLHTGSGTNSRTDRYWGQDNYVWNNGGDTARLRNAAGTLIDTCRWTSTGDGRIACS